MDILKQGMDFLKVATDKVVNTCKKASEIVVEAGTKAYIAVGASLGALLSGTPAKADLATTLGTVETAATAGVDTVSTSVANVYISVFGLILLGVGIGWLFGAIKKR